MGEVIVLGLAVTLPAALCVGLIRAERLNHFLAIALSAILSIGMTLFLTGINIAPPSSTTVEQWWIRILAIYGIAFGSDTVVALVIGLAAGWFGGGVLKRHG
jgi:hypothetical protein